MLREFFVNENPRFLYVQFGLIHHIFTILCLIGLIIIYFNRNHIMNMSDKKKKIILKTGAIIMLLNMIIYTFGNLYYGSFNYKENLPFHLCFIANYMFIFGVLFNKHKIFKYTIFLSFIGPIPAILWPDLVSTIDNYNFWQYVISHHFFINLSLFSYYALSYHVGVKNFIKTFILTNLLILVMYPFNIHFHTNYIFSTEIPANVLEIYPWVEKFPPILTLEVLGFLITGLICYGIIKPRNKELSKLKITTK